MSLTLHIERLILEGLEGHDPAELQAALTAELTRLLADGGSAALPTHGLVVPALVAPTIDAPTTGPRLLGAQIARAVYTSLGNLGQPTATSDQAAR